MSWDSYIDNILGYSKDETGADHIDKACIIGKQGGAKWTSDAHPHSCKLSAEEAAAISKCFATGKFDTFMSSGVYVEGQKYQFLREVDGKTVMAKAKERGAVTVQSTKTAVVIAHVAEGKQQGIANKAVDNICQYLEQNGM